MAGSRHARLGGSSMTWDRPLSWAATDAERDEHIGRAQIFTGSRIVAVRYFDIDYRREAIAPGTLGPRQITAAAEWEDPGWRFADFDSIDYGLEIDTEDGRTLSITWDPLGDYEGISIEAEPLVGTAIREDGDVAIWDVTASRGWAAHAEATVERIDLRYQPWDEQGAWWCPRITLHLSSGQVEIVLGEGQPDGTIGPSADNLAILFSSEDCPDWLA
jgi:hypothetical protein